MSNTPLHQEMDVNPAPETPSPGPNGLNFTDQVQSLLNGESPAPISPDDNIPGAPVSVLETDSQNGNNSAPDEEKPEMTMKMELTLRRVREARTQHRPPAKPACLETTSTGSLCNNFSI